MCMRAAIGLQQRRGRRGSLDPGSFSVICARELCWCLVGALPASESEQGCLHVVSRDKYVADTERNCKPVFLLQGLCSDSQGSPAFAPKSGMKVKRWSARLGDRLRAAPLGILIVYPCTSLQQSCVEEAPAQAARRLTWRTLATSQERSAQNSAHRFWIPESDCDNIEHEKMRIEYNSCLCTAPE